MEPVMCALHVLQTQQPVLQLSPVPAKQATLSMVEDVRLAALNIQTARYVTLLTVLNASMATSCKAIFVTFVSHDLTTALNVIHWVATNVKWDILSIA
jgi:hypothetical protein